MNIRIVNFRALLTPLAVMLSVMMMVAACGTERVVEKEVVKTVEVEVPGQTVVVEKEVVKTVEVEVPGQTIVVEKEVVKTVEVEVPGQTVVKEVVKTVEVPGQTIVVEKEVVKTVEVEKPVEVIREVLKEVEVVKEVVVEAQRPMVRPSPGTVLNIVTSDVGPANWHRPIANFPYNTMSTLLGVSEHLLDVAPDGSLLPMIASRACRGTIPPTALLIPRTYTGRTKMDRARGPSATLRAGTAMTTPTPESWTRTRYSGTGGKTVPRCASCSPLADWVVARVSRTRTTTKP